MEVTITMRNIVDGLLLVAIMGISSQAYYHGSEHKDLNTLADRVDDIQAQLDVNARTAENASIELEAVKAATNSVIVATEAIMVQNEASASAILKAQQEIAKTLNELQREVAEIRSQSQ